MLPLPHPALIDPLFHPVVCFPETTEIGKHKCQSCEIYPLRQSFFPHPALKSDRALLLPQPLREMLSELRPSSGQHPPQRQHPCTPRGDKPILALLCPSCSSGNLSRILQQEPAGGVAVISHRTPPVTRPQRLDGEGEADAPSRPATIGGALWGLWGAQAEQLCVRLSSIQAGAP